MARNARVLLFCAVVCLAAGSCDADSSAAAESPTDAPVTIHPIPDGSQAVIGTAECGFFDTGTDPEDPEAEQGDLVICELEMSDARVSGTEVHDRLRYYDLNVGQEALAWVSEEATITNDEGTWRGIAQAMDDGTPMGEALYVGEGAYDGLEFRYYFSHQSISGRAEVHGWISSEAE